MAVINRFEDTDLSITHTVTEAPQDRQFPMHVHDYYEMFCFVSGNASYTVEGHIYELHKGSLLLMRSAETHKLIVNGSGRYERYTLHFRPQILLDMGFSPELLAAFTEHKLGERNLYVPSEFSDIKPIEFFEKCFREMEILPKREVVVSNLASFLCALYALHKKNPDTVGYKERDIGREVIEYINENLAGELSLETISREVHMSQSQISRVFRRLTGTSVYDYVLSKRIIAAQELISKGVGATEASQRAGFRDYSSFYRLCKKRTGNAPTGSKR